MDRIVYAYALTKSLCDSGYDYLDTFVPFIIRILAYDGTHLNLDEIKIELYKQFHLNIPDHVITEICKKGVNKGYFELDKYGKRYIITANGSSVNGTLTTEKEIERRANYLAEEFAAFLKEKGFGEVTLDESLKMLIEFINRNLTQLTIYMDSPLDIPPDRGSDKTRAIIDFILKIEKSRPDTFSILTDLLYGSIICTIAQVGEGKVPTTLENVAVFLDSNTLFSILGLHYDEINRPCQELLTLLHLEKCNIYVFDFTVDEMTGVLNHYAYNYNSLWENVKVDTIYSSLRRSGKSVSDVRELIAHLEESLEKNGIIVYRSGIKITDEKIHGIDTGSLISFKPGNNEKSLKHDLLAIQMIMKLRNGGAPRKLEECQAVFVSSDAKLAKYDLIEHKHRESATITEVILDKFLTQLLWVKNPVDSKIPLYSAIATHSRALFVDRNVWNKFFQTISKMKDSHALSMENLGVLLYSQTIEDFLVIVENPDDINEEFVNNKIELTKSKAESELKKRDDAIQEKDELLGLKDIKLETASETNLVLNKSLDNVIKTLETISSGIAQVTSFLIWVILLFFVYKLCIFLGFHLEEKWNVSWSNLAPFFGVASVLGLRISLNSLVKKVNNVLSSLIFQSLKKMFLKSN